VTAARTKRRAPPADRGGAAERFLALPARDRSDFVFDRLWSLDWWMRGRMMRLPGYVHEAHASREELVVADALRTIGAVLRDPPADPDVPARLYRAVGLPPGGLPAGERRRLVGRPWRTARRPLQSWTDSLASAREFAASHSGRALLEPGADHFIVEADIAEGRVLFRHGDLLRGLRQIAAVTESAEAAGVLGRHLALVEALGAQREVVVDLPRGEAVVLAFHEAAEVHEGDFWRENPSGWPVAGPGEPESARALDEAMRLGGWAS
jgi:hypothetical protein